MSYPKKKGNAMDMEKLKKDLAEIGCSMEESGRILQLCESGNYKDALQIMKKNRCRLMDELHESGRKVDCADFLIRKTEKEMKQTDLQNGGI